MAHLIRCLAFPSKYGHTMRIYGQEVPEIDDARNSCTDDDSNYGDSEFTEDLEWDENDSLVDLKNFPETPTKCFGEPSSGVDISLNPSEPEMPRTPVLQPITLIAPMAPKKFNPSAKDASLLTTLPSINDIFNQKDKEASIRQMTPCRSSCDELVEPAPISSPEFPALDDFKLQESVLQKLMNEKFRDFLKNSAVSENDSSSCYLPEMPDFSTPSPSSNNEEINHQDQDIMFIHKLRRSITKAVPGESMVITSLSDIPATALPTDSQSSTFQSQFSRIMNVSYGVLDKDAPFDARETEALMKGALMYGCDDMNDEDGILPPCWTLISDRVRTRSPSVCFMEWFKRLQQSRIDQMEKKQIRYA